jgi:pimeloyl-ACP methyl ester carboxylesterase
MWVTATEIRGIDAIADQAGLRRFHLYGYSAGAAYALAYATVHPHRVLSLALDEPATDFTPADRADPAYQEIDKAANLPAPASVAAFLCAVVAPGVTPLPGSSHELRRLDIRRAHAAGRLR